MGERRSAHARQRVFIVDDHPLVREWLGNLLRQQEDLAVCGEADSIETALPGIVRSKPEVAIVDLSLGNGWGLELIRQLAQQKPETRIIVLSMHDEKLYAERTIRAGARGYVMKRETAKVIVAARQAIKADYLVHHDTPSAARKKRTHLVHATCHRSKQPPRLAGNTVLQQMT